MEAGLDSLGAVELRNVLASRFNFDPPATLIFDHPSASALAHYIATQSVTTSDLSRASSEPHVGPLDKHSAALLQTCDLLSVACRYPDTSPGAAGFAATMCGGGDVQVIYANFFAEKLVSPADSPFVCHYSPMSQFCYCCHWAAALRAPILSLAK